MKIVVNTRFLLKNKLEGIGWFSYEILKRLTKNHPEITFYFLFDRPFDETFLFDKNVIPIKVNPPARHPFLWYIWFEFAVPRILNKIKPDAFISTDGFLSLNSSIPSLLFWHDMSYWHFPQHTSFLAHQFYQKYTPLYLKRANEIITFSEHSKLEIIEKMQVNPSKISLSTGAARMSFRPISNKKKEEIKAKYADNNPYFLYVGALQPRKNVDGIIRAFDIFKTTTQSNHKLLLTGRMAWKTEEITLAFKQSTHQKDIIFLGHLDNELEEIVAAAFVMVYPSFYEGFGLPIIEAINCHVPVITSHVSSMPEVCGDAGILVNPTEISEIALSMIQLFENPALYTELQEKCKKHAQKFNWDKTAEDVYRALTKLLGNS